MLTLTSAAVHLTFAQAHYESLPIDTLNHVQLEEVVVSGTRAKQNTPVSYSSISASDIKRKNNRTIRGTDATRINVTLNGIPLNNPESQEVFWVNLPDLSNSMQNIQIGQWH